MNVDVYVYLMFKFIPVKTSERQLDHMVYYFTHFFVVLSSKVAQRGCTAARARMFSTERALVGGARTLQGSPSNLSATFKAFLHEQHIVSD